MFLCVFKPQHTQMERERELEQANSKRTMTPQPDCTKFLANTKSRQDTKYRRRMGHKKTQEYKIAAQKRKRQHSDKGTDHRFTMA